MATTKTDATLTTREMAEKVGTTPKLLRVFLRASDDYDACGSGARYVFKSADVTPMKTRFATWQKEREAKAEEARKVAAAGGEVVKAAPIETKPSRSSGKATA